MAGQPAPSGSLATSDGNRGRLRASGSGPLRRPVALAGGRPGPRLARCRAPRGNLEPSDAGGARGAACTKIACPSFGRGLRGSLHVQAPEPLRSSRGCRLPLPSSRWSVLLGREVPDGGACYVRPGYPEASEHPHVAGLGRLDRAVRGRAWHSFPPLDRAARKRDRLCQQPPAEGPPDRDPDLAHPEGGGTERPRPCGRTYLKSSQV